MLTPLVFLLCASPQLFGPGPLQPYRRASPDGHWELSVDPTARDGSGPATYHCALDGKDAWSGEKPWTFWDALVTNDGFSAGYSYSRDGVRQFAEGDFHAVILAPDGTVRLDDVRKREPSGFEHEPSNPLGAGLFEQPDLKRVVFRIADPDLNRNDEQWWAFRLPEAKEEFRKGSRDALSGGEPRDWVIAVRGLRGTTLTLVEWRTLHWPKIGLRFSLLDAGLAPVWDLSRAEELTGPDDDATRRMQDAILRRGTLFEETPNGRFAIGLPKSGEKIHFAVEGDAAHPTVREIGREPWSLPEDPKPARRFSDLPVTRLQARGEFQIPLASREGSPIRDVAAFDVSVPGIVRVVRREKDGSFTLLRVDSSEKALLERRVRLSDSTQDPRVEFWALGPETWLATRSPFGDGARALAWRIDESTGDATPLAGFDCPAIEDVAAIGKDRFVVLARERETYSTTMRVRAFDPKGALLWELEADTNSNEPADLFSPEAVAVTREGLVAVLDVIRHTIQLFDSEGKFRSRIDLATAWGHEPRYPCGIRADVEGGVLVHDFSGDPPLYRMKVDGTVRAKFAPRFPDGKSPDALARRVRVGDDGHVWSTDDQRVLRLDAEGVVDLQLGTQAVEGRLVEPWAVGVDVFGRILVQDRGTSAIHVFDGKGKSLFVCRPSPTDTEEPDLIAELTGTQDRGVLAQWGMFGIYLRFGPDGARRNRLEPKLGGGSLVGSTVADEYFGYEFGGGVVRLGPDLSERGRLDRAPDGSWLGSAPAVGPDGALAAWHAKSCGESTFEGELVVFDRPDAKDARALPLPSGTRCSNVALGRSWAALSSWKNDALLVRRKDGKLVRVEMPTSAGDKGEWRFGFDPAEEELIAVDGGSLRILRFALP